MFLFRDSLITDSTKVEAKPTVTPDRNLVTTLGRACVSLVQRFLARVVIDTTSARTFFSSVLLSSLSLRLGLLGLLHLIRNLFL